MGRHQKLTAAEVKEHLDENVSTIGFMADNFNVSKPTVRSRLRTLREDGNPIIHDKNGIRLISREELTDADIAKTAESFAKWVLSCIKGHSILAQPLKPLLPQIKRTLQLEYTPEERRELAISCIRIKALIDWSEVEKEME